MKDWDRTTEEELPAKPWWRDRWNDANPRQQLLDDILVALGALLYVAVVSWPLHGMLMGGGPVPRNMSILGGLIGLLLAAYAVMSDRIHGPRRGIIAGFGIFFIAVCWGFGPL